MSEVKAKTKNTMIRLPLALHERVRKMAEHEHRSMNAQVVVLLEKMTADEAGEDRRVPAYSQ